MNLKHLQLCEWDRFGIDQTAVRPLESSGYEESGDQFMFPVILENVNNVVFYPYGIGSWNGYVPNKSPTIVFHLKDRSPFSSNILLEGYNEGLVYPWVFVKHFKARHIFDELQELTTVKIMDNKL